MIRKRVFKKAVMSTNRERTPLGPKAILSSCLGCLLLMPFLAARGRDQGGTYSPSEPQGTPADWPMVGHDPGGNRYSTLNQITPANVRDLKVAWVYHMKPATKANTGLADVSGAGLHLSEDQPLVIGPTMPTMSTSCQSLFRV